MTTRPFDSARLCRATLNNSSWYLDQLITFLAIGDDTYGRFALLRVHGVRGAEPYTHYHTREDETIYLLDGEMTVRTGDDEWALCPGDVLTIPRGLEHVVRNDSAQVTYLQHFSPAGFERYFYEMSAPAEYLGPPPNPMAPTPTSLAQLAATASRYGCVVTTPAS